MVTIFLWRTLKNQEKKKKTYTIRVEYNMEKGLNGAAK